MDNSGSAALKEYTGMKKRGLPVRRRTVTENGSYEPQSRFARLWLDSQHDNLPKGIRTIKMCKLYSNDALVMANGLASIVKENV